MRYRESFLVLAIRKSMGDHRGDVQAALHEDRHLVPGLEDLTSVHALDIEHLEDHLRPVDWKLMIGEPEHRDTASVRHVVDHLAQCAWHTGHLEGDVESLL